MQKISRIASGAPWEPIFGYSRAVRAGDWVAVSGTTSFDERGTIVGPGQMYVQARQAISNIATALERAGVSLAHVVRTRIFVTDIARFNEVARAHQESFGANPPASTAVEVRRLVHPDMLVEIEADAFFPSEAPAVTVAPVIKAKSSTSKANAAKPKAARKSPPAPKTVSSKRPRNRR
jgi:enamine deaminase RidA (YjgF/YER057c/UK114 family)